MNNAQAAQVQILARRAKRAEDQRRYRARKSLIARQQVIRASAEQALREIERQELIQQAEQAERLRIELFNKEMEGFLYELIHGETIQQANDRAFNDFINEVLPPTDLVRLTESLADGRVEYYVLNSEYTAEEVARNRINYREIIRQTDINKVYNVWIRRATDTVQFLASLNDGYIMDDENEGVRDGCIRSNVESRDDLPDVLQNANVWWHLRGEYRYNELLRAKPFTELTVGRLEGFSTTELLKNAPAYVGGWIIALIPQQAIGETGRWLSMRENSKTKNCVAETVRRLISKTSKDNKLSAKQTKIIDDFEKKVLEHGCENEDLEMLDAKLKMKITIYDIAGNKLYERVDKNGKPIYDGKVKHLDLYRSNGHVTEISPMMPDPTDVEIYIPTKKFDSKGGKLKESSDAMIRRCKENVMHLISSKNLQRCHIIGQEVIDSNGVIHRPINFDIALHEASASIGQRIELMDTAENYNIDENGNVLKVLSIGGATSLKFKHWREQLGICSISPKLRELYKSSTIEAIVWKGHSLNLHKVQEVEHYDMKCAYLGCDSRDERAIGAGYEYAKMCGFPRGKKHQFATADKIEDCRHLTGIISFESLELADDIHPSIKSMLCAHFEKDYEVINLPIPVALFLNDNSLIKNYKILYVAYCPKLTNGLIFPNNRDDAIRFIGSCAFKNRMESFATKDKAEADYYAALLNAQIETYKTSDTTSYLVSYPLKKEKVDELKDHSHIRCYVLAYTFISLADEITQRTKQGIKILATNTDAFVQAPRAEEQAKVQVQAPRAEEQAEEVESIEEIKWGQFRLKKDMGNILTTSQWSPIFEANYKNSFRVSTQKQAPQVEVTLSAKFERVQDIHRCGQYLTCLDSQGGSGKTTIEGNANYGNKKVLFLCQNNIACNELRDIKKNPKGYPVKTYHEYFRLKIAETEAPLCKSETFDAKIMEKSQQFDTIIWDEYPLAGADLLSQVLPWLINRNIQVILCGDALGQLQDINDSNSGEKVIKLLQNLGCYFDTSFTTDYRAKDCLRLREAKLKAWRQPFDIQLEALKSCTGAVRTFEEVKNEWHPDDIILEPTLKLGADISQVLQTIQAKKYPDTTIRLRFKPHKSLKSKYVKKNGIIPKIKAPNGEIVETRHGIIINLRQAQPYDKMLWVSDATSTIHSIQGQTIKAPRKIYICLDSLCTEESSSWCKNALYVAMSRAEKAEQLIIFHSKVK